MALGNICCQPSSFLLFLPKAPRHSCISWLQVLLVLLCGTSPQHDLICCVYVLTPGPAPRIVFLKELKSCYKSWFHKEKQWNWCHLPHLWFHLATSGSDHSQKERESSARIPPLGFPGVGGRPSHSSCVLPGVPFSSSQDALSRDGRGDTKTRAVLTTQVSVSDLILDNSLKDQRLTCQILSTCILEWRVNYMVSKSQCWK